MKQDQEAVAKLKLEATKVKKDLQKELQQHATEREKLRHQNIMEEITALKEANIKVFHREDNIKYYTKKNKNKKEYTGECKDDKDCCSGK